MTVYHLGWLAILLVEFGLLLGLGIWIRGQGEWLGILVNRQNRMSLSRFQLVMWTWLITSTFVLVALATGRGDLAVPTEIWALLGISVGSAGGAVIVKGSKKAGRLWFRNLSKSEDGSPALSDMFKGEEQADFEYVDIGKVQMFFFTLVLWVGYFRLLWPWIGGIGGGDGWDPSFPQLSEQMVLILGISHTGYLTIKAAPKGDSKSSEDLSSKRKSDHHQDPHKRKNRRD